MPTSENQQERRQHTRYTVPNLVIALPKRSSAQIARIINISKGGLAVRYLDQNNWLGSATKIDILANSDFFINNLPIKLVEDFKIDNDISFSITKERQSCLQFDQLSVEQQTKLEEFIQHYTASQA
jgi:hypothetical protein